MVEFDQVQEPGKKMRSKWEYFAYGVLSGIGLTLFIIAISIGF